MAEYNATLAYQSIKNDEKFCRYSYASWCPTCDRDSPRRRTRSETKETCRRKGKEMKTFTPKRYNRCREYENMEVDFDGRDSKYECCRTRLNFGELPTTYITNNCQIFNDMSNYRKVSTVTGAGDYQHRTSKAYESTVNIVDLWNSEDTVQMHSTMIEKQVKTVYRNPDFNDGSKLIGIKIATSPNSKQRKTTTAERSPQRPSNGVYLNSRQISSSSTVDNGSPSIPDKIYRCPAKVNLTKSSLHCNVIEFNGPPLHSHQRDTCTFFNRKEYDIANIKERYHREVEELRAKLREIQKSRLLSAELKNAYVHDREVIEVRPDDTPQNVQIVSPVRCSQQDGVSVQAALREAVTSRVAGAVPRKRAARRTKAGEKHHEGKARMVAVKSRSKINLIKIRQAKSKVIKQEVTTESDLSEMSDDEGKDKVTPQESKEDEEAKSTVGRSASEEQKLSDISSSDKSDGADGDGAWPLRDSLFPNMPPYIKFNSHDAAQPFSLPTGRKHLKWKLSTITPILVRKTLTNTGFVLIRKSNEWLGCWGKHMKSPQFATLKDTQKLNHFPGTFQVGRKDRLWKNLQRLMLKYGYKEFGFIPQSFILPQDAKLLKQNWCCNDDSGSDIFIIKPPASARGTGIKVIHKWSQIPKKQSLVVQRYISNPYLINGSKFDLRLYVLVTSFNPLRIYLYPEGLARFASAKYSDNVKDLKDRYMHLTNYSINKLSSQYTANEDAFACQGHKWTLTKLWEYLEKNGVDTKLLWKSMEDLVIKTMISGESSITQLSNENLTSRYNCYELFGIDILLDERLKCWLLEVNISPSLHSASPLDTHVKGPMVQALFDLAQFHLPPKLSRLHNPPQCYEPKLYTMALTKRERAKQRYFTQIEDRQDYVTDILNSLTGDDVRHLTQAEDELTVMGSFARIFPTSKTYHYQKFMEVRYHNRLFDAWETRHERSRYEGIEHLKKLCSEKLHMKVGSQSNISKDLLSTIPALDCHQLNILQSTDGATDKHLQGPVVTATA